MQEMPPDHRRAFLANCAWLTAYTSLCGASSMQSDITPDAMVVTAQYNALNRCCIYV